MATWSNPDTFKLIKIWGEDAIQAQLEGCRKNKVYEKIPRELSDVSFQNRRTVSRKCEEAKSEYRKVKHGHNKTGVGWSSWRFLDAIGAVIGDKPATKPLVVIDSLEDSVAAASVQLVDLDEESDGKEDSAIVENESKSVFKFSDTPV